MDLKQRLLDSAFHQWLLAWKPIPLCWLFRRMGWKVPRYLIGHNTFSPALDQFRWYEDSHSSAVAAQNTNITRTVNSNSDLFLRVQIQETGGASGSGTDDWQLQYSKNSGAYTNVTASSANVQAYDSAGAFHGGSDTNNLLTGGTGSDVAGEQSETGIIQDWGLSASNNGELLYTLRLIAADLANNDTLDFRVLINGSTMTYTVTPRITVSKSSASAIAGTASGTFGQNATLTGRGALAASQGAVFGQSATLTATGALAGVAATVFADAATLTAAPSQISGTGALVFGESAVLAGSGALAGAVTLTLGQAATLTGSGALAGVAALSFGEAAALTADGPLNGTAALVFGESATLTATGALAGTSSAVFADAATLIATGALAGSAALTLAETAALTASGALAGSAGLAFTPTGTLDAPSGALAGAVTLSFGESAALTGTGALTGTAAEVFGDAAALSATGALIGGASLQFGESAVLRADGALAGAAPLAFGQAAALTGTGALAGAVAVSFSPTGTLDQPDGSVAGTAAIAFGSSAALTGVGALAGVAAMSASAAAVLSDASAPQPQPVAGGFAHRVVRLPSVHRRVALLETFETDDEFQALTARLESRDRVAVLTPLAGEDGCHPLRAHSEMHCTVRALTERDELAEARARRGLPSHAFLEWWLREAA